jgi:SAM-dependent methyltransferase
MKSNIDEQVVSDFGKEWQRFDQSAAPQEELRKIFDDYFSVFPWHVLPKDAQGFDLGCGSGRWAWFVAPRAGKLHCVDPADAALAVARAKLQGFPNCEFHLAGVDAIPLPDDSMDFGYSLGVLHHVPDTQAGIANCVSKLKPGAPFLIYLYYAFDNRPWWFKAIWRVSDLVRKRVSAMPSPLKFGVANVIALLVYFPSSRAARLLERLGIKVDSFPLSAYRDKSFYTLRTDALDRFGTRLEQRFTKEQIASMMAKAGLERIEFRDGVPYWCAVGYKQAGGKAA